MRRARRPGRSRSLPGPQGELRHGEGELALQPWLQVDEPDLLASDLCRGWIDALEDLGLTHLSGRLDDLSAGSPPMPSDLVLFNLKRRSPPKA
jgi:hypothetical protein